MSNSKSVDSQSNGCGLQQLWQTVHKNPTDFVGWTLLLQYCEHMKNIESIRDAFNSFLSKYPFCYIYWKKFVDYELEYSDQKIAIEVLERAVNSFPISVDIWIHYIQLFIKLNKSQNETIGLFERAIKQCGNDYNSYELWSLYLNWLTTTQHDLSEITLLYDRIFKIAIKNLNQFFDNFVTFVGDNNPICILTKKEYNSYSNEYLKYKNNNNNTEITEFRNKNNEEIYHLSEESVEKIIFIRKKIIAERKQLFELTLKECEERKYFEDRIKRPYFHVNPLDITQLDNWSEYLNWEIDRNIHSKVILLFERCLVCCALYEHMWIRYSNYLIEKRYEMISSGKEFFENFDINAIRNIFRRATEIHLKKSFKIHNLWSLFEEREGNFDESVDILNKFESENPVLIEPILSKINLYHRKGDLNEVDSLFRTSIEKFLDSPKLCSHLSIKYSRFLFKVIKNRELATEVLNSALKRHPNNYAIYLRLIDIEYQNQDLNVTKIETLFEDMIKNIESISLKLSMTQRKLEFMQDFGFDCQKIQSTINRLQNLMHGFDEEYETFKSKNAKRFKLDN